jgi:hypothetical protein
MVIERSIGTVFAGARCIHAHLAATVPGFCVAAKAHPVRLI